MMITPEQIPKEVLAVFKDAWFNQGTLTTRESLAAALKAWPNAQLRRNAVAYVTLRNGEAVRGEQDVLILPLPPEPRDE